jgi:hypothetical protein
MIFDVPKNQPWYQANKGDYLGSIWASRNIDLKNNYGNLRVSEKNIVTTDSTDVTTTWAQTDGVINTLGGSKAGQLLGRWVEPFGSTPPTLQNFWSANAFNTTSITKSITIPAGTNQSLIVMIQDSDFTTGATPSLSTVTFNGVAMTNAGSGSTSGGGKDVGYFWYYVTAPTNTTADVVVTWASTFHETSIGIYLMENVVQTGIPISTGYWDNETASPKATYNLANNSFTTTGFNDDHTFIAGSMTEVTTHTYSGGPFTTKLVATNINATATVSYVIYGENRLSSPQSLVTAFCKEAGTVGGVNTTRWWAMSNTGVYQTSSVGGDFDTDDSGTLPTFTENNAKGDMTNFNGKVYLAVGDTLYQRTGTAWTVVSTALQNGKKILRVYTDRLYIASDTEVDSVNTSNTVAGTGTNYLDISIAQNENLRISCMREVSDGLWIGTSNYEGGRAKMMFWDGETGNTLETIKTLESGSAMAMTIKDDVPYVLDNRGVLMKFNGSYFEEVARFDFDFIQLYNFDTTSSLNRWIHPNGMQTVDDEILMLVNTRPEDTNDIFPERHPAGIYAYHPDFGIYHKYSLTSHKDEAGYTDLGYLEIAEAGAIFPLFDDEENNSRTEQSDFFVSYTYKDTNSTNISAIAKEDKRGLDRTSTVKAGSVTTTWIRAEKVQDTFKKLYTFIKPLASSSDKLIVKYRKERYDNYTSDITWVNTTSFTSTDVIWGTVKTSVDNGVEYEVEGISGDGAGFCSQIASITESSGTYTITLDETITGATTNTARVRVTRWSKVNTNFTDSYETEQFKEFNPDVLASKVQFKIYMQGTDMELDRLVITSSPTQDF